jgi:hypothetical protein
MSAVICAALVASATVSDTALIDALIAGCGELPSLESVQRAAVDSLAIAGDDTGLAPKIDVAIGSDADVGVRDVWQDEHERTTTNGRKLGVELAARWELGELVFSDSELRANREALARSSTIQLARERVTKLVWLLARAKPTRELAFAAARLDGLIAAMTGGTLPILRKE